MLSHEQDVHARGYKNEMAIQNKARTDMKCLHHYGDDEEKVVDWELYCNRMKTNLVRNGCSFTLSSPATKSACVCGLN